MIERSLQNTADSWDKVWAVYDRKKYEYQLALEEKGVRWQQIADYILKKFGTFYGLKCLEIGAGCGHYSMLFARQGARVVLLDYSEKALEFCRIVFKDNGISEYKVKFIHMGALKIEDYLLNKFDVSMSFGVAEHFQKFERKLIFKAHYDILRKGGITFISVPHANCIPFRIYQAIMKFRKRDVIECYPYSLGDFRKLAVQCNISYYFFIGSSFKEAYNPLSFYRRKKGLTQVISKIKREKPSCLDKYLGREITFVAIK